MIQVYPELPDWEFDIDEVSAGVYEVVGRDRAGHRVQAKGTDPDALLTEARASAKQLREKIR